MGAQTFGQVFGAIVKKERRRRCLTQEDLANAVDASRLTILRIEKGEANFMPAKRALAICEVLGLNLTEIWKNMNAHRTRGMDG